MFECTLVSQIPIAFIHETWFSSKSSICKSFLSPRSSRAPFGQASRVPSPKTTVAMAASAALRRMMAQDPVLTACAVLSAIGLGAPLIVPPIRNAMNRPEPITPPKLANVVEGMTGKARN